ncbi:MAG TPA: peroxiredoxin [Alphaproteobacteria bacterium]|nr:peroxiredoxin [Alphaproteobacteria bacterium]
MPRPAIKRKSPRRISTAVRVRLAKPSAGQPGKAAATPRGALGAGSKAPAFSLPAIGRGVAGGKVSSADLKGKSYVLYFYPKDDTSGCTAEACGFRDSIAGFNKLGLTVIGVSKDSLASHEKFAKKYDLNFPLASDEKGELLARYGVWVKKSMYGRSYMGVERSTFLIDGKGAVRAAWRKVSVPRHVEEVRKAAAEL